MKNKKLISALLAITCSLGLCACGNSSTAKKDSKSSNSTKQEEKIKDGGTMVFAFGSDPTCLNPLFQGNRVTFTINNAIFSPLYVTDKDNIKYYLADKVDVSPDKLTYKLKLKDNLKWHDGKKITVDDVIFTINTIWDEKQHADARDSFIINNKKFAMKKIDDLNLEIKLPQTYVPFKDVLGGLRPIPKHIFDGVKDMSKSDKNNNPVGSGPYKFKEWKKGDHLTLERFNDYCEGKPHIDKIVYKIQGDKNSSAIAFENGEINATYLSESKYNQYTKSKKFKTYKYDECMPEYVLMDFKNQYLKKKEVRQAISYAINKTDVLKSVYENIDNAKPANSVFPPSTLYYTDNVKHYEYNPTKAKELLKKANVKNVTLKFGYISGSKGDINEFNVLKQNLQDVGITLKPVVLEQQTYFAQMFNEMPRTFDMTFNAYVCGTEPSGYADIFTTKGAMNTSNYSDPELDKVWEQAVVEVNPEKRKEMYEHIQKVLADDAVQYNINYATSMIGVSSNIGGVEQAKTVPIYMFEDLSKLYFIEK